MRKLDIVSKAYELEQKWKNYKKIRKSTLRRISKSENFLSEESKEKILEEYIKLFWLITAKCFREDEYLKKLSFFASRCTRINHENQ